MGGKKGIKLKQNNFKLSKDAQDIMDKMDRGVKGPFVSAAIVEKYTYDKVLNINKKFIEKTK